MSLAWVNLPITEGPGDLGAGGARHPHTKLAHQCHGPPRIPQVPLKLSEDARRGEGWRKLWGPSRLTMSSDLNCSDTRSEQTAGRTCRARPMAPAMGNTKGARPVTGPWFADPCRRRAPSPRRFAPWHTYAGAHRASVFSFPTPLRPRSQLSSLRMGPMRVARASCGEEFTLTPFRLASAHFAMALTDRSVVGREISKGGEGCT